MTAVWATIVSSCKGRWSATRRANCYRWGLAKMGRSGMGMWPDSSQPIADTQERGCCCCYAEKKASILAPKFRLTSKDKRPVCFSFLFLVLLVKVEHALRQLHRGATSLSHLCKAHRMVLAGGRCSSPDGGDVKSGCQPAGMLTIHAVCHGDGDSLIIIIILLPPKNKPYLSQSSSPFSFCSCCRNGLTSNGCFLTVATPGSQ